MKKIFVAGRRRKLGLLPKWMDADIPKLDLPTSGPSPEYALDLSPLCPPINDQGQIGDCASVSACTFFYEFLQRKGLDDSFASWTVFYKVVRKLAGLPLNQDTGSTIADTVNAAMKIGFCPASVSPINDHEWTSEPTTQEVQASALHRMLFAYYCPNTDTIDASLAQGFPVVIGMELTEAFESIDRSGIYVPRGKEIGGHAMGIVGVDNKMTAGGFTGFYKMQNQWSAEFGYGGHCFVPKALVADGTIREAVTGRRTQTP